MSKLYLDVYSRSVIVDYGKSKNVTSQILTSYFGYCGKIERLLLDHESKRALVVFERGDSAQTALLLNNGLVCEGAVAVLPLDDKRDMPLVVKLNDKSVASTASSTSTSETTKVAASSESSSSSKSVVVVPERSVFVAGISANTLPQNLFDFFSFCGTVEKVNKSLFFLLLKQMKKKLVLGSSVFRSIECSELCFNDSV